jgi:tetratricopeptide (TPR) repeat protein
VTPAPTPQPRRSHLRHSWLIPALFAVVLFIGDVTVEVLGDEFKEMLKPYRKWVWAALAVALIAAVVAAIKDSRRNDESAPAVRDDRQAAQTSQPDEKVAVHHHYHPSTPHTINPLRQLQAPPRDFTGRQAELKELTEQLGRGVTIAGAQGAGGVGKTALALKLAEQIKDRYPDAQFYLDLRGVSERPLTAIDAMLHVIRSFHPDYKPNSDDEAQAAYRDALDGRRALLLMDNARSAEEVAPLIPPAGCVMIVTSRFHFAVGDLHPVNLDALPMEDARELLLKIESRIGGEAEAIAELCGRLPLALELAANALKVRRDLTPKEYAGKLGDAERRIELLDRTDSPAGRKIEAALDSSYELLDATKQSLWRALSVFPADFDCAAAAAVWQTDEDDAKESLWGVVSYSLVEFSEQTRRYRLHDLARLFAAARLREKSSEDERRELQHRHAAHFQRVLAEADDLYLAGGEKIKAGLDLFYLEWRNIEAGQAWAASQINLDPSAARLAADYPDAGVYLLDLRHHPRERIAWLEAGLEATREIGDRRGEGQTLGNLGLAYADLGEPRKAIEFHEQQLKIAHEIGDRRGEGNALNNLGLAYADLGKPRKAIEFYEQDLKIAREIGDRRGEGNVLNNLGLAYADLGEPRKAIEVYEQKLKVVREIGDRRGVGSGLGNLGNAYADLGEPRKAIEFYEQQLEIAREMGDRRGEGLALGNLGAAYGDLGEPRKAIEFYEQYLEIAREVGNRRDEGNALWNLSLDLDELGERAQAIAHAEASLKIREEIEDPRAEKVRARLAEWRGSSG